MHHKHPKSQSSLCCEISNHHLQQISYLSMRPKTISVHVRTSYVLKKIKHLAGPHIPFLGLNFNGDYDLANQYYKLYTSLFLGLIYKKVQEAREKMHPYTYNPHCLENNYQLVVGYRNNKDSLWTTRALRMTRALKRRQVVQLPNMLSTKNLRCFYTATEKDVLVVGCIFSASYQRELLSLQVMV